MLRCWAQVAVTSFQEGWFYQPWRRWRFASFLRKQPWTWTLLDNLARVSSWDGSKHSAPEGPGWNMDPFQMEVRSGYSIEMILVVLADNLRTAQDGAGVSMLAFSDHFSATWDTATCSIWGCLWRPLRNFRCSRKQKHVKFWVPHSLPMSHCVLQELHCSQFLSRCSYSWLLPLKGAWHRDVWPTLPEDIHPSH